MFEKESKEYINKIELSKILGSIGIDFVLSGLGQKLKQVFKRIFQDGAEFGYNKANEWHYVEDGDLPTHPYRVLIFTDEGVGFGIYGLDNKKWYTYDTGFDVIAWKEIVLPKEIE